ncbi:MAG: hypothetical protein AAF732_03520 [Pseudomonadota bacterium]
MTTFLISYDLADPSRNKQTITSHIMAIGEAWARPLDQTWYVRCAGEAANIEAEITSHLGDEDGLIVQEVGEDVVFANTALRWFRRRPIATADAGDTADHVPAAAVNSAEILSFPTQRATDVAPDNLAA